LMWGFILDPGARAGMTRGRVGNGIAAAIAWIRNDNEILDPGSRPGMTPPPSPVIVGLDPTIQT
jgi:hypothetical protein